MIHLNFITGMEDYVSFRIPTQDHPARAHLDDMHYVAECLNPANLGKLPDLADAIRRGRKAIADTPGCRSVTLICLNSSNDERWLISVGSRGGWRKIWNFGDGRS